MCLTIKTILLAVFELEARLLHHKNIYTSLMLWHESEIIWTHHPGCYPSPPPFLISPRLSQGKLPDPHASRVISQWDPQPPSPSGQVRETPQTTRLVDEVTKPVLYALKLELHEEWFLLEMMIIIFFKCWKKKNVGMHKRRWFFLRYWWMEWSRWE